MEAMKIRALKKRVLRLLDPQIVRGRLMRTPIQMHRAFGFVYPLRKNKRTQVIARFGKTTVTRITPGLIENDLPADPTPIDPISKSRLVVFETDFSEIKSEPSQMQQWLEDGSAEIVPGPHGTRSIVNKE
jgi:hypothetical protein